jgi:hypothetical protein
VKRKSPATRRAFRLEASYELLLTLLSRLLGWLIIALLATLTGVLRLLAGFMGLIALLSALVLLATLVLIGTCHDKSPLVIVNV